MFKQKNTLQNMRMGHKQDDDANVRNLIFVIVKKLDRTNDIHKETFQHQKYNHLNYGPVG